MFGSCKSVRSRDRCTGEEKDIATVVNHWPIQWMPTKTREVSNLLFTVKNWLVYLRKILTCHNMINQVTITQGVLSFACKIVITWEKAPKPKIEWGERESDGALWLPWEGDLGINSDFLPWNSSMTLSHSFTSLRFNLIICECGEQHLLLPEVIRSKAWDTGEGLIAVMSVTSVQGLLPHPTSAALPATLMPVSSHCVWYQMLTRMDCVGTCDLQTVKTEMVLMPSIQCSISVTCWYLVWRTYSTALRSFCRWQECPLSLSLWTEQT